MVKRRPEHKKLVRWPTTTARPRLLDKGIHLDRADCPRAGLVLALPYTHFRALASSERSAPEEVFTRKERQEEEAWAAASASEKV